MSDVQWILLVDEAFGRLCRVGFTGGGRVEVVEVEHLENTIEPLQHERPSPLSRRSVSGEIEGRQTYASRGHEDEAHRDRFAKMISVWVEQQAQRLGVERLAVFAGPRFLGALRDAWSPRFALQLEEYHKDLTGMSVGELAQHDDIIRLVQNAPI